jgi:protein-S-isoprenylcysteine O-methyltransferase Ste14
MIARLVTQTAVWLLVMAALLFVPAGTWRWPQAWALLLEMGVLGLAVGLWLARHDPALLRERLAPLMQAGQKRWDKIGLVGIIVFWCAWFVVIALDAKRFHWSHVPVPLQLLGGVGVAFSIYVTFLTFRENSFAAPVVKVQRERGQKVVATGPYRLVRHPMYAGALFTFLGIPLLLGSWWGVGLSLVLIVAIAIRSVLEERTLEAELDGYTAYKATVRYRMIPFVW